MNDGTMPEKKGFSAWLATTKGKVIFIAALSFLALILVLTLLLVLWPDGGETPPATEPAPDPTETLPVTEEKTPVDPGEEMRGVFIATVANINFPSKPGLSEAELKNELDIIVETSRSTGFDTLYFQVRPTGDAFYKSAVFPSSRYLMAQEGDALTFDPLSYLIEQCALYDMQVVAWVNPYRVTNINASSKEQALASLSEANPARQNPHWTVFYDGKLYYDPALPEVQKLILDGVKEILEYGVAGVLYDDYFYPYPVSGQSFDDSASFSSLGEGKTLGDFRRENVNALIHATFDAVKAKNEEMTFGVSPFGIWQNTSSHPGGSATNGTEAYSAIFCDALAWIEGEYVDYIAPQIYWERGHKAADFSTLARWWSAQVDGTSVRLYIAHAAYKVGDFDLGAEEIVQQIRYARAYMGSYGNIQYGFADIVKNTKGLRDALRELYADPTVEEKTATDVSGVTFLRPGNGARSTYAAEFVTAASDPTMPVYMNGQKIGRTKSGLFSVLMPLSYGKNTLLVEQNGKTYTLQVSRVQSTAKTVPFAISAFTPSDGGGIMALSGTTVPVTVTAQAGCTVTVSLGNKTVTLRPTLGAGGSAQEVYEGVIAVPAQSGTGSPVNVGRMRFVCKKGGVEIDKDGPTVSVIPKDHVICATVTKDYTPLKVASDSSFYDDYTSASVDLRDRVTGYFNGHYRLACGAFVPAGNVRIDNEPLQPSSLATVSAAADASAVKFTLALGAAPPLTVELQDGVVRVKVFNTVTALSGDVSLAAGDLLFSSANLSSSLSRQTVTLELTLQSPYNYYGFHYSYENGTAILSFRQPSALAEGDKPLAGKTIVVDAGHGGTDVGALGYRKGGNEEDLNLKIALTLEALLEEKGATVIMSRSEDATVSLTERIDLLTAADPDLSVSVHHNSTHETTDANTVGGTLGLYWSEAGLSLADHVKKGVLSALHTEDNGTRRQMLALCRNPRFPQTLVEVSFICAPSEYHLALRDSYARDAAQGILDGILSWYAMQAEIVGGNLP